MITISKQKSLIFFVVLISLVTNFKSIEADEHDHIYEINEEVVLWVNTVGPYHNRQETYPYFSLPFCAGPKPSINHYHETLGENLLGVELEFSGVYMAFQEDHLFTPNYCSVELSKVKYELFAYAIKNHYWYQMYIDDLPIWGIVGEYDEKDDSYWLWTSKKFEIGYNGDRIIDVNLTSEQRVKLVPGMTLRFSYEVTWKQSKVKFEDRFDKYLDPGFFQHRIHWFSIFNSFMMVIFLVGIVSMILMRTLRKDYARYNEKDIDDMERDLGDEYGWKQVHGDVFRPPYFSTLLSSLIGSGYHLASVVLIVVCFAIVGELYTERGSLLNTTIFMYAVTSPINGYFGGSLYARSGGKLWIRQMVIGALLVPACVSATAFFINFIAVYYQAAKALHFTSMLAIVAITIFVILPCNLIGTLLGRAISGQSNYPCRVNAVPRPIPEKKWYTEPLFITLFGGLLPFGSIFIEVYFVFTSFWAYKIYYVYGFMLLVFMILVVVTICVTIVTTYFLLNAEDYRWQWTSFFTGASIGVYIYMYSFYYYFFKTKMFGLFQTTFYFGYMALLSGALGLMCGTFGFIGSNYFVRIIYSTVKID